MSPPTISTPRIRVRASRRRRAAEDRVGGLDAGGGVTEAAERWSTLDMPPHFLTPARRGGPRVTQRDAVFALRFFTGCRPSPTDRSSANSLPTPRYVASLSWSRSVVGPE